MNLEIILLFRGIYLLIFESIENTYKHKEVVELTDLRGREMIIL